jgi:hypothetical protein
MKVIELIQALMQVSPSAEIFCLDDHGDHPGLANPVVRSIHPTDPMDFLTPPKIFLGGEGGLEIAEEIIEEGRTWC